MANNLLAQLDYIYFFYGLVLFLLGAVCVSMSRTNSLPTPWWLLGAFAFTHGLAEWLHLVALVTGDSSAFRLARDLLLGASFLLLLEFARRTHRVLHGRTPGRWLHLLPSGAVLALGLAYGPGYVISAVRPLIAAPAIFWTAWLFLFASRHTGEAGGGEDAQRARILASIYFTLFGVTAGLVVPSAPFIPPHWPSAEALLAYTGIPIQLLRGATVCMMALSVWALAASFERSVTIVSKKRFQFWAMAAALSGLLAGGWLFTNWLGRLHEKDTVADAESAAAMVYDHLSMEMEGTGREAHILAGLLARSHAAGKVDHQARLDDLVDSVAITSEEGVVYVLDPAGTTIATSNRHTPKSFLGKNYAARPYFQAAVAAGMGTFLGMGLVSSLPGYFAAEAVRGPDGRVAMVAVVKRNLGPEQLGPPGVGNSFIISGTGEVVTASRGFRPGLKLWSAGDQAAIGGQATPGAPVIPAGLLDHAVLGTEWVDLDGQHQVAIRRDLPGSDWSVLTFWGEKTQLANRVLGIIITLLLSIVVLASFVAMERQLGAEAHLSDRHLAAESRARDSARQADTDPLTGVMNRLGFGAVLGRELERSRRYGHPLSVVMLDLDHFKKVNDVHGHGAGDQVLVGVTRLVEVNVRDSDTVGRLGGEEFVVLAPSTPASGAVTLAEKLRTLMAATALGPAGRMTGSFGVAELLPTDTAETLLHRADEALYRAKSGGRNRVECGEVSVVDVLAASAPEEAPVRPMLDGSSIYAATGYQPIDGEHRALSEAINSFLEMIPTGRSEEIEFAFESILAAAGAHFRHEERLMKAHHHPDRVRHAGEHARFTTEALRLLAELGHAGVTVSFRRWAVGRLPEWFRLHIIDHDLPLGQFLHQAAAQDVPAVAERV